MGGTHGLDGLPADYAAVLGLRAEGLSEEEIAERLSIRAETVASLLRTAGAMLATLVSRHRGQGGITSRESQSNGRANGARTGRSGAATSCSQPTLDRPRLMRELEQTLHRRLTIVHADAGFGKSTTLEAWSTTVPSIWYTIGRDDTSLAVLTMGLASVFERRLPAISRELRRVVQTSLGPDGDESDRAAAVATLLCEALDRELDHDLALVFDDAHELWLSGSAARLLEELWRQAPDRLHIVLSTRLEPPFPVQRLRGRGQVLDLDAAALAFTEDDVAELLRRSIGADGPTFARKIHELTGGWPAAVRLTAEALRTTPSRRRMETLEALRRPGGRLFDYVAEEVLQRTPPAVRELLRFVTPFDRFNADLCRALGAENAADVLPRLRRAGLFLERCGTDSDWFGLHALIRDFVRERWPLDHQELEQLHARAAAWFHARGRFDDALESVIAISDEDAIALILETHGETLLASGRVDLVVRAGQRLRNRPRDRAVERVIGQAHEIRGDWDEALACFERAAAPDGVIDAALAWRLGLLHHLRGELDEALAVYERGTVDGPQSRDAALLLAWKASVQWLRGDEHECRSTAEQAFACARATGDPTALAAAHTVLAMLAALTGDRLANDAHYVRALEYAERAGDILQAVRVRTNRGSRHLEEGEYDDALAELESALQLSDLTGFTFFRALALTNRGEVYLRLGRLEQATADLDAARLLYQRAASRMISYPLEKLGDVYRIRGELASARASYEEAVTRAEESGDAQGLVPSLAGLAQVIAEEDPQRAELLLESALSQDGGMGYVTARLAAGWVALKRHDRKRAAGLAEEAADAARRRRDRAGLAEALELRALATPDRERQIALLEEAVSLWRAIHDPVREAGAELILGTIGGDSIAKAHLETADGRLRDAGAHGYRASLMSMLTANNDSTAPRLSVTTLGRFTVTRKSAAVAASEWQSKKARDLLKLLLTRRGKPAPREWLMEALWPGQDPRLLSNRLSVALSTLRSVLDPDRQFAPDHFLVATADTIGLSSSNVDVDVEQFLAEGQRAVDLYRDGAIDDARGPLQAAESSYSGDFLEGDRYEEWAEPLREEASALYVSIVTALAEIAEATDRHDAAIRYRLRALERDRWDEGAHLGLIAALVSARRHGEARRAYRDYLARMDEIGVEPAPFTSTARHGSAARRLDPGCVPGSA
jgi:ATP/maltotriose-dependent transcriptional regulator MalT/DNA-binding SARP family transcriptional activator